jgi:hypothetical protein
MDGKQPLVLIFMVMAFGIAVAAAIWVFGSKNLETYRSGIVNDLTHIASDAYAWRMKPATLGGGGGSYEGYVIPEKMRATGFGIYEISPDSFPDTLFIVATATRMAGSEHARIIATGFMEVVAYHGDLRR